MYIKNGIAYAGEPAEQLKVNGVVPLDNYVLHITFNNNEQRMFDMKTLLSRPAYAPLKNETLFKTVTVDYGCPVWNNGDIDIAPEYLFENGTPIV